MAPSYGPTTTQVDLALRLRGLRREAGITQAALADLLNPEEPIKSATVSSYENPKTNSIPPESRLEPYARLFGARVKKNDRLVLLPAEKLTPDQRARADELYAELRQLWESARASDLETDDPDTASAVGTFRSFYFPDGGKTVIVCPTAPPNDRGPLADHRNPNYTELHALGDADSLLELWGHIRAQNHSSFPVRFVTAIDRDALTSHLVLLGGVAWNPVADRIMRELRDVPVSQDKKQTALKTGDPFIVRDGGKPRTILPTWSEEGTGAVLEEDVGLIIRVPNPFNVNRTLTILNGIHSRGVYGAVRALTDEEIRESNELYLAQRFPSGQFAILMRVPVVDGEVSSPDLVNKRSRLFEWTAPLTEGDDA